jgi:hypothetical protein
MKAMMQKEVGQGPAYVNAHVSNKLRNLEYPLSCRLTCTNSTTLSSPRSFFTEIFDVGKAFGTSWRSMRFLEFVTVRDAMETV